MRAWTCSLLVLGLFIRLPSFGGSVRVPVRCGMCTGDPNPLHPLWPGGDLRRTVDVSWAQPRRFACATPSEGRG